MRWSLFIPLLLPLVGLAQTPVAPVTGWLATVDSATQQIELQWRPSADSTVMGYHVCSGNPCLDYDTVFGRLDTSYICLDHSPLEQHTYRLHAFDSTHNVSELTPFFGNVVLEADIPACGTTVSAHWNRYEGFWTDSVNGEPWSILQARLEPFDTIFRDVVTCTHLSPQEWSFEIPDAVTRVWLRVLIEGINHRFRSLSNMVVVERHTVDTASVVAIESIEYDSLHTAINLTCSVDTAFEYTLYRSIDNKPWRAIATFQSPLTIYPYSDTVNPYDSLHCYRLGVKDACEMNERYSAERCVVVPTPPDPKIAIPNAIIAGDAENGTFRPVIRELKGDLYELDIYDRHGMHIHHSEDPAAGWTPPAEIPQGAYAYLLRCRYNTNEIKSYAGTFIIIK